jgi:uncharacterized protein
MKLKRITFFILLTVSLFTFSLVYAGIREMPRPRSFVTDTASLLSSTARVKLESLLRSVETKTTAEVAVVTILSLNNEPVEDYATALFEKWGIGKKGKDNGVLFLVAKDDRKMRIEVGYGLEGALPDGLVGSILDTYVIPEFRKGNYSEGITSGTMAIVAVIGKEYDIDLFTSHGIDANDYLTGNYVRRQETVRKLFSFLFILAILSGRFFWPLLIGHSLLGRRYWYGGRYYRGGGSFSSGFGGFGGFGGGLSGGGGASRGW